MDKEEESRAVDFTETDEWKELAQRGSRLLDSLFTTIDDIWWGDVEDKVASLDSAISQFNGAYVAWAGEVTSVAESRSSEVACKNELASEFSKYLSEEKRSIEDIAASSDFTIQELRALRSGKTIAAHHKLEGLPDSLKMVHKKARSKAAEALFSELRSGICPAEATRMMTLLKQSEPVKEQPKPATTGLVEHLESFSKSLMK